MLWSTFKWGLLWSLFILIICFLPGSKLPNPTFLSKIYFDKIIHLLVYLILFILVFKGAKEIIGMPLLFSAFYCIIYGLIIELVQHFLIIDRSGELFDVFANVVGVFIGMIFVIIKKKNNRNEPMNNLGLLLM